MVQIRPAAAQELKRLLQCQGARAIAPLPQIYMTLETGGCADWTYRLTTETAPQPPAITLTCADLRLVVSADQLNLLKDLTIDYSEDLMGGGFRFTNPLAQRTCGCGNAFSLSADAPATEDCTGLKPPT